MVIICGGGADKGGNLVVVMMQVGNGDYVRVGW
jgi:hypothetical protein